ncbi:hypothetical protein LTSESEN_0570 [Salmonella enterica subsp. enterica serovar Senftenberg str. A4-543]|uniref:Uncharacterized protein n=1 Tax=Salmonella enterica subsp. enterica serovar Senftenberg str. A4-543 TaxID=913082 RepID=G5QVB0_SALSE|nr:hypothetical protein LTSESEN_0570 [Salmonella enterica subsp. enterica serovar Senftenberg str. A4-543]
MWYLYRRFQVVNQQLFRAPGNAGQQLFRAPGKQCRALFYWLQ